MAHVPAANSSYRGTVRSERIFQSLLFVFAVLIPLLIAGSVLAAASPITPGNEDCASNNQTCNVCVNQTSQFTSNNLGQDMVQNIFTIINKILNKIESTFYTGIVGNPVFQEIIGATFLLYIGIYGIMITFDLASFRSGEVINRLIKLSIVYAMTTPGGWTFFSAWIQQPVLHAMDQLITNIANNGMSGASGGCVSAGQFSGASGDPIQTSGTTSLNLSTGPMAMMFGPMTCVFSAKFVAGIQALITTGFFGWLLALALLWGLYEFALLLLASIVTYVKAVVGLVFLFGLAPIFFAFYLFQKTRSLTEGWISMVAGFALQPVMLFTFLAFYAGIIGASLTDMFTTSGTGSGNMCYVPWYTMPGMFQTYTWRFVSHFCGSSGAAGGQWIYGCSGASSHFGDPLPPPVQILNVLYFLALCNLGKNFTSYIEEISNNITGGSGAGTTDRRMIGSWFQNRIAGGQGPLQMGAGAAQNAFGGMGSLLGGGKSEISRAPMGGGSLGPGS